MDLNKNLRSRFLNSIMFNIIRSILSVITGLLLARWLGPSDYGRMSFLIVSFVAIRNLIDFGTSSAFFTFLSQRKRSGHFINIFWRWILFQLTALVIVVIFLFPDEWLSEIWSGETRSTIFLALIATFMQGTVWPIAYQMGEADRKTLKIQRLYTLVVLSHLIAIILLWYFGTLALQSIFILLFLEWSIAAFIGSRMYEVSTKIQQDKTEPKDTVASVFNEFYAYCLPFIPYAFFSFAHDFTDRWMLQRWGGSKEQAFYTISYQFATISLIATTSILKIFWKEIAEAYHNKNHEKVRVLYLKVSRGLFFVGAVIAGALIPWTNEIIDIMLGPQYKGAKYAMLLMFIYPVHQSIGQIASTILLATGKTDVQAKIGIIFMVLSIISVYFFLAPQDLIIPGLGLASDGLAWKMVIMQFIQVNVLLFIISRLFKWDYDWKFQVYGLLPVIAIGFSLKMFINLFIVITNNIINMTIFGIIYICIISSLIFFFPKIAGLTKDEINFYFNKVFK